MVWIGFGEKGCQQFVGYDRLLLCVVDYHHCWLVFTILVHLGMFENSTGFLV